MMTLIKVKEKNPKKDDNENPSFHQSVGWALAYGQFFGMLPADGVLAADEEQVEFRWKSIKTIYSMIFLFCGTVESCLGTRRLLRLGFKLNFAEGLLFFISAMVRAVILFRLARKWKGFIKYWRECEDVFLRAPYRVKGWSLRRKINIIFFLLAALSMSNLINFIFTTLFAEFFLSLSRALFLLDSSNKRQPVSTAELHSEIADFLGELFVSLPATLAVSFPL